MTRYVAACPYCDFETAACDRPDDAKRARFEHLRDEHPDRPMSWWQDTESPREVSEA